MNNVQSESISLSVQPQLDIADMAQVLRTTEAALRMRLYRSPKTLPPFYRVGRLFRWDPATVQAWIENQTRTASASIADAKLTAATHQPIRNRRSRQMRELARA